jgi:alginate O-acetyltransferase complex protein AlgI
MLFNSISFAIFLTIVFILHWFVMNKNSKSQNVLLVVASFVFYAMWDWRFLLLMLVSKSIDFISTIQISRSVDARRRKRFLHLSIFVNVAILGFFKYFNFFADSFSHVFSFLGFKVSTSSLQIVMPVGLSFYTMQALGYVFDVYQEEVEPTHNIIDYFAFLSFFPLVLAGPIERASNLLHQLKTHRVFNYSNAVDGLRQILWGLFKKVVIADNCASIANLVFDHSSAYSGSTLVLGALFFTFQIYCDFSGYSDMAIGIAKLFNINLMQNFAFPYFSRNIGEFWKRWHISLSSWLFDYIFKPLQMTLRDFKLFGNIASILITFIICGIWHGSNWTFIIWGVLNAIYFIPSFFTWKRHKNTAVVAQGKYLPSFRELFQMGYTFLATVLAWIFFRSDSIGHAISYIRNIFKRSLFSPPDSSAFNDLHGRGQSTGLLILLIVLFLIIEWVGREQQYAIAHLGSKWYKPIRWAMYYAIILAIFHFTGTEQQFIYFQF